MMSINRTTSGMVCATLTLALVQGCTVGPHYHPPTIPTAATYTPQPLPEETVKSLGLAGASQHFDSSAPIPVEWWTLFRSPDLDRMVETALKNSPTLAQAKSRLRQAQEELNARSGSTKYPTVTGSAGAQEQQLNLAAYGIPFPNPSPFTLLNGSIAVSYALDLFGANRHLVESLRAERDYEAWQLEGARLMLAGNVVAAAVRQAQVRSQIQITRQLIDIQKHQLQIAEERHRAGGVSDYDLKRQEVAVAQMKASIPPLELQLDSINDQLAVLMGMTPAEAHAVDLSLDALQLPEELPLTLPSTLVRQRPDVRAAEALLHQAGANVGVATADLYPQIVLSGGGGAQGMRFDSGGNVWNVGAAITAPIYNGGALHAEKRKAEAAYDEAFADYRQTVLQSFREVADALFAIQRDAQTLEERTEEVNQAERGYQIAAQRYGAGGISQISMLDAQRQQLQAALDRTSAAAARFTDSATLIQALGGGWWSDKSYSK